MMLNSVDYKVDKYLTLIPFGDMHYGSKDCDVKIFEAHLDLIRDEKNCAVILMGDLINCGTHASIGAKTYDDKYNPEEQYYRMLDYLYPLKKKIIGAHIGNHEERIREISSFNITKMLCDKLKFPYLGYSALHKIKVNNVNFHIYSTHGSTSATTITGKMSKSRKAQETADADIYLCGHTHALDYNTQPFLRINNRARTVEEHTKHFILTGNFVKWDGSYGEKKNYQMLSIGVPKIKLFGELSRGKKKVEVKFTDK